MQVNEGNVYIDAVDAVINLIKDYSYDLGFAQVYDIDIATPETPSVAVVFDKATEEKRTQMGAAGRIGGIVRSTVDIDLEVWFYHSQFSPTTNEREVVRKLWEISQIFRLNPSIKGFASVLGCTITGCEKVARLKESVIYAGGLITLRVNVTITSQSQS